MSLFPHQNLHFALGRLETQSSTRPDDLQTRLDAALVCLSRAEFHGAGEDGYERALEHAAHVLRVDPDVPLAHVVAGAALVGLDRPGPARVHLDRALELGNDLAEAHYARGLWYRAAHDQTVPDPQMAVREVELACQLAPEAWEPHALLANLLWERARDPFADRAATTRRLERAQFHCVRALELRPPADQHAALRLHLARTCAASGLLEDAARLLARVADEDALAEAATMELAQIHHELVRPRNALTHLRAHLARAPGSSRGWSLLAQVYLDLGELPRAAEAADRALALDPLDAPARWVVARLALEEGRLEAARARYLEILADVPDHAAAFADLVDLHGRMADGHAWYERALNAEVVAFSAPAEPAAWRRIERLVDAIRDHAGPRAVELLLGAIDRTRDEALRFFLWEEALDHETRDRAVELTAALAHPGERYGAQIGREVLAAAHVLDVEALVAGLHVEDEDLARRARERGTPIDHERREARAWQALLLVAIGVNGAEPARALLARWAAEADPHLADAARAGLVILGEEAATEALLRRARARGTEHLVEGMRAQVAARSARTEVRALRPAEERTCAACGSRAAHAALGGGGEPPPIAVCDRCLGRVALDQRDLEIDDPEARCALSGRGAHESAALYRLGDLVLCREVVDFGLGLAERAAVARYLSGDRGGD